MWYLYCDNDNESKYGGMFFFSSLPALVSSSFNGVAEPAVQSESSVPSSPEAANSQCEFLPDEAPPPRPLPDLVDDALLHVSPRVSIPKKREVQTKHQVESKGAIVST